MQSGHAIADFIIDNPLTAWKWNKNSNVMVSLSTPDHSSLKSLAEKLQEKKIPFTLFYEPDISEHTAIATTDAAADLLKGYPLALKESKRGGICVVQNRDSNPVTRVRGSLSPQIIPNN